MHANGLFMLSLFTLVYLFPLLSFFLFNFLWYGTNVPGCVETLGSAEKEGGREKGAYAGICEFLSSTQSSVC